MIEIFAIVDVAVWVAVFAGSTLIVGLIAAYFAVRFGSRVKGLIRHSLTLVFFSALATALVAYELRTGNFRISFSAKRHTLARLSSFAGDWSSAGY